MRTFLVMAPPKAKGREDLAMKMVFLRDGFSLLALLYPAFWLLLKRMWVVLICYLLITFSVVLAGSVVSDQTAILMAVMVSFIFGFEARALHRWALERRGWRLTAVVQARTVDEAERRFFAEWLDRTGGAGGNGERPDPPVRAGARQPASGIAPAKPTAPVPQVPRPTVGGGFERQATAGGLTEARRSPSIGGEPAGAAPEAVRSSPFRPVARTAATDAATAPPPGEPAGAGTPPSSDPAVVPSDADRTHPYRTGAADADRSGGTGADRSAAAQPPSAAGAKPAAGARRLPLFPPKGGR